MTKFQAAANVLNLGLVTFIKCMTNNLIPIIFKSIIHLDKKNYKLRNQFYTSIGIYRFMLLKTIFSHYSCAEYLIILILCMKSYLSLSTMCIHFSSTADSHLNAFQAALVVDLPDFDSSADHWVWSY